MVESGGSHTGPGEQDFKSDAAEAADTITPIGGYVLKTAFEGNE